MRREVKIGIFFVGAILILLFFLLQVGWLKFFSCYALKANFDYVGGVESGVPVRLRGVEVGKVNSVRIEGDRVQVVMHIDNAVRIPKNTIATVNFLGLMGERYIELIPPTTIVGYLPANSDIEGRSPVPTEQLLVHAQNQFERFLKSINQLELSLEKVGLVELSTLMRISLIQLNQLLTKFNQFLSANSMATITQTLNNIAYMSSQINTLIHQLSVPIKSASVSAKVGMEKLSELFQRLNLTIQQIQSLTNQINDFTKDLSTISGQIKDFAKNLSDKSLAGKMLTDEKLGERLVNIVNSLDMLVADLKAHPWKLLHKK